MSDMRQFGWPEMRSYWERHAGERVVAAEADDDLLSNVCYVNQPLWLNRYHAGIQQRVFASLLDSAPSPGARALDVGCGSGRWSRLLAARGYGVLGVDLQESLIARNRERMPGIDFRVSSIQDVQGEDEFALITSVTVIQHVPYGEQEAVADTIARLLQPGGRLLILENTRDVARHVFAHDEAGWERLFSARGLRRVATLRYDYSPCLRVLGNTARVAGERAGPRRRTRAGWAPRAARGGLMAARRAGVAVDSVIEPRLIDRQSRLPAGHCGMLFEAP